MLGIKYKHLLCLVLVFPFIWAMPVIATKLAPAIKTTLFDKFPQLQIRLDGSIQDAQHNLYLPLFNKQKNKAHLVCFTVYSEPTHSTIIVVSSTCIFAQVIKCGKYQTISLPKKLPIDVTNQILRSSLVDDLLVPDNFVLPKSLKSLASKVDIATIEDSILGLNKPSKITTNVNSNESYLFLTSPSSGRILMLDQKDVNKITDFQTDGTPASMAVLNNQLLVTDQAKNRVLILDPKLRSFTGQIDLAKPSAPKGIACTPQGNFFYISESASNNIDVVELSTKKVLLKTRVPNGPGKLYITPDGKFIVVLNTAIGGVSLLTTYNQRLLCTIKVGSMPNACAITSDSTKAFIANRISNSVSVIDLLKHKVIAVIKTGAAPTGIALTKQYLLVANAKDNNIQVFDSTSFKLIKEVKLPLDVDFPGCMMVLDDNKRVIVSSEATEAIGVLDLTTLEFKEEPAVGCHTDDILLFHHGI